MSLEIGKVYATVDGDTRLFSRSMGFVRKEGESTAKYVARQFNQVGDAFQDIGRKLTLGLTLPIVGLGTASLMSFGKLETALSRVEGLVGIASDQLEGMREELLRMAPEVGRVPQELAEGLFFVTSAGFRGAEAMDVLRISAKAASAGLGETRSIADLLTSAINAYGRENLSAADAADILTAAVREGKLEAESLAPVMGRLLPLSKEVGLSFEEMSGFLAAMSRTGLDASTASTALRGVLSKLVKPTEMAKTQLAAFGLSAEGLRQELQEKGLLSVLRTLEATFGDNQEAMGRVFEDVEALVGVLNVLGQDAGTVDSIMQGVAESAGSLGNAFDVASDTLEFKWNAAVSRSKVILIGVGDTIKDAVLPVLDTLNDILQTTADLWQSLTPQVQKSVIVFAGIAAAIGPVLFGLGGILKLLPLLASGFAVMTGPVGLAVAAIAGGAILIYKNWDMLREFFATGAGAKMFDSLVRIATTAFNMVVSRVEFAVGAIMAIWNVFGESIVGVLSRNLERLTSILIFALDHMNSMIVLWSNLFTGNFSAAWDEIQKIAARAVNFVLHTVSRMVTGMLTMVSDLLAAIGALETVQNAANKAAEGINSFADSLKFAVEESNEALNSTFNLREALGGLFKATEDATEATGQSVEANKKATDSTAGLTSEVMALSDAKEDLDRLFGSEGDLLAGLNTVDLVTVSDAIDLIKASANGVETSIYQMQAALAVTQQAYTEAFGGERREELQQIIDQLTVMIENANLAASSTVQIGQGAQFAMQIANEFTNSFGQGMTNVIVQGEKLLDTLRNIGKLLVSSAIQKGIGLLLSGGLSGAGFFGSGGGLIGKIFGRASGGSVLQGQPYMVGEKGPELFVPNVTGTIQPNGAGASSISVTMRPVVVPIIGYDGLAVRIQQSTSDLARRGGV